MADKNDAVDPHSLTQAREAAARTGVPQPVLAGNGRVLYYVDSSGAVVPTAVALDARERAGPSATTGQVTATGGLVKGGGAPEAVKARAAAAAAQQKTQQTVAENQLNAGFGNVWVDGKQAKVTGRDAQGNLMVSLMDGGVAGTAKKFGTAMGTLTAFDALNQSAIDPATQFVMSVGTPLGPDGNPIPAHHAVVSGHDWDVATPDSVQNRMTVGSALTWLASLSSKDPGAFQAMVDQLHRARYLNDADYSANGAVYDSHVGQAFSQLALDVASLNTTAGGANTSLHDYLANKAAHPGPDPNAYKPVTRTFTDPNEVRAAAENAAQAAIGRKLTPQEQAALTAHFHGQESSMFDQIDAAGRAHTGASVTQPTATGAAYAEINDNPALAQEQAGFSALQYGDVIKQLMGVK